MKNITSFSIFLLLVSLQLITSTTNTQHDIPEEVINNFYQAYDKPGHTSGIHTNAGDLHLQKQTFDVNIYGAVAEVEITQHYNNYYHNMVNADYIFAVSPKAAFVSLQAEYDNTILKGVIKEKNVAKKEYMEEIKKGKKAAYSEIVEGLHDMMILRIGNISPGSNCIIKYKYIEKLSVAMNKFWRLQIPFRIAPSQTYKTATVEQKMAISAKHNQQQNENREQYIQDKVYVKIHNENRKTENEITFLESPTHKDYIIKKKFKNFTQIYLDPTEKTYKSPKNSFELLFRNSLVNKPTYTLTHLPSDTKWPYVAEITFFPDFNYEEPENAFRNYIDGKDSIYFKNEEEVQGEFIFLLDRSGSMAYYPMRAAIYALLNAIYQLPSNCKYNVISFGSSYEYLFSESQYRSNYLSLAKAFTKILLMGSDLGGTDIIPPLEEVYMHHPIEEGFPRSIFIISDGAVSFPDKLVQIIYENSQKQNSRVYTLGIGNGVDLSLIIRAAQAGNGLYEFSKDTDLLSEKLEYLIKDAISESLDKFYLKFDKNVVDMTVPDIYTIQSIRKNQAFSMFLFLNDEFKEDQMEITLEYRESFNHKVHKDTIVIEKKKALENVQTYHNLGVKNILDSILFNAVYSPLKNCFSNVYTRHKQNSVFNFSVELSTKYQVLSEFTSFILKEQEPIELECLEEEEKKEEKKEDKKEEKIQEKAKVEEFVEDLKEEEGDDNDDDSESIGKGESIQYISSNVYKDGASLLFMNFLLFFSLFLWLV